MEQYSGTRANQPDAGKIVSETKTPLEGRFLFVSENLNSSVGYGAESLVNFRYWRFFFTSFVPGAGIAYNSRRLPPARSQAAPRGAPRHLARRASLRSSTPPRTQSSLRTQCALVLLMCPGWGSNPHDLLRSQDFESCASASSATRASFV